MSSEKKRTVINKEEKITGFRLDWYDCGLSTFSPLSHVRTMISRNSSSITIKHMKDPGIFYESRIPVKKESTEEFFNALSAVDWETNYSVSVCDGYSWEMILKSGTSTVTRVKGTVVPPSETKELERMIRDMIDASGCPEIPPLWGNCYEENEE